MAKVADSDGNEASQPLSASSDLLQGVGMRGGWDIDPSVSQGKSNGWGTPVASTLPHHRHSIRPQRTSAIEKYCWTEEDNPADSNKAYTFARWSPLLLPRAPEQRNRGGKSGDCDRNISSYSKESPTPATSTEKESSNDKSKGHWLDPVSTKRHYSWGNHPPLPPTPKQRVTNDNCGWGGDGVPSSWYISGSPTLVLNQHDMKHRAQGRTPSLLSRSPLSVTISRYLTRLTL